jgi:Mce-associated membrane protein
MAPRKRMSALHVNDFREALAAAEEAEAEAAAAEARAVAVSARALAITLRRQAEIARQQVGGKTGREATDSDTEFNDSKSNAGGDAEDMAEIDGAEGGAEELTGGEVTAAEVGGTGAGDGKGDTEKAAAADVSSAAASRSRRRWLQRMSWRPIVATAAIVLTVALLAITGGMVWQDRRMSQLQQRSAEFAATARQGVVTLMSLDFNHAKDDVQRIIDNSTGNFKKNFQATADDFIKGAQGAKAVSKATVDATAVESMDDNSAVVLVAASTTVANSAGVKDEPRSWRLSVTVTRDGKQLKIANVEFVP